MLYQKKNLSEKAAAIKKFEYSLLGSELKKLTSGAEKQYQRLNKISLFKSDKKEELVTIKIRKTSNKWQSKTNV